MITPSPQDPLAAMKKSSPNDPIIPALEHINNSLDSIRNHAKSIARDANSLLKTRKLAFLVACLLSAGAASAGTWYAMRQIPPPPPRPVHIREILRQAGVEVAVMDTSSEVSLRLSGGRITGHEAYRPNGSTVEGFIFTWSKNK